MLKYIAALLIFLAAFSTAQNLKELKKMPLDTVSFPLWDSYVKDYAPADSAYSMLHHFGRTHLFGGRPSVAYHVYDSYKPLFPDKKNNINKMIDICLNQAISRKADREEFEYYHNIILKQAPSEEAFVALQRLAAFYLDINELDSAAFIFKTYKEVFPDMKGRFDNIIDLLERNEDSLSVTHFPAPLNTGANEWDPNPTPDGHRLFFSSNRAGSVGGADIWFCDLYQDSVGEARRLGHGINSKKSETIDNVLFDGSGMTISGNLAGTFGQHDIYTFISDTSGKFAFKHLPYPINTEHTDESANITADGRALLFCSDRPGGIGKFVPMNTQYHGNVMGNTDLYVSIREDGKWGDPINLGNTINTPYAERTPYLHPDGKTLYFSSDGHYGLGGLDVFVSRRLSDTSWTEWSEPENLGRYVNTSSDDWGYKISLEGKTAYFTADNLPNSNGGWDIYKLVLPDFAQAEPIVTIYGTVTDYETEQPISTIIRYEDLSTGKILGEVLSSSANGSYIIALPLGKNYGIYTEKPDYLPYATNINLSNGKEKSLSHNIRLQKTNTAATKQKEIRIDNIYFDYDQATLKKESIPALNRFVKFLRQEGEYNILIEGHTDQVGSEEYNMELSRSRALAVKNYLIENGIKAERLEIKAYGKTRPLIKTSDVNEKNRRVSFRLIK